MRAGYFSYYLGSCNKYIYIIFLGVIISSKYTSWEVETAIASRSLSINILI